jgi:oxygen-independent coproporphyrinogen III oxidase
MTASFTAWERNNMSISLPTINPNESHDHQEKTGLGNYFVANYPPFSHWKPDFVSDAERVLNAPPRPGTPLGLYLHIPFCRKRCKFCYFRVYTDKNARDVETYQEALLKEVELYSQTPAVKGRPLQFVYFGGGTPSYLSVSQLQSLIQGINRHFPAQHPEEVTFECEPGTLQQPKLAALKQLGITRLSLGVENFSDRLLEENGRAHRTPEIWRAYGWAEALQFEQINIDLIAGMVGETWDNWKDCIQKTIDLSADSVTIYQMELPFNTVYSKEMRDHGETTTNIIADWPTKRAWVEYGFDELEKAGYERSSGYTMVKDKAKTKFIYRDSLWHGADLLGTGVASFGHVSGVHMQNVDGWDQYIQILNEGRLPLNRAFKLKPEELLTREMVLQLKTGALDLNYFRTKFGVDVLKHYQSAFTELQTGGYLNYAPEQVRLTTKGLMQIDRLLPVFFDPAYQQGR